MRPFLLLIGWLLAAPALFAASVEFQARLWSPELSGSAVVGNGFGTTIDLVSDLGFADEEMPEGRLIWRPTRRSSVRLDYSSVDFAGNSQLDQALDFGGMTFQLDAQVASVLELEYGGVGFAWQFLSTRDGRVRLGPLVEVRGFRGEAGISTDILGVLPLRATETFELGFAAAGIVFDFEPMRKIHIYAEWSTSVEANEGDLTDVEAGIEYYPIDFLALTAGFRRLEVDFADGNDRFDLELDGPFFGGVLRF